MKVAVLTYSRPGVKRDVMPTPIAALDAFVLAKKVKSALGDTKLALKVAKLATETLATGCGQMRFDHEFGCEQWIFLITIVEV